MNARQPRFDSHRFVKRLVAAGLSQEVAEVLADEHARVSVPADVATKADLDATRAEMEQRLQNAILEAKVSLIKWMIGTIIATMTVFSRIVIGAVAAFQ